MKILLLVSCLVLMLVQIVPAQDTSIDSSKASSFDLMVGKFGLSFGDGQTMTGIRFAWRDGDFGKVNGLNLSLWIPYENPCGVVNGISFGILGPSAERMSGISFGVGGVMARESMAGINIGGLGLMSQGTIVGFNFAGLGIVSQRGMAGANIAGLGLVSQGNLDGVTVATLGVVSQGDLSGMSVAGLGIVSQKDVAGLTIAGLGIVSQKDVAGITIAGLGVVSQGSLTGVQFAGLAVVTQGEMLGLNVAGAGLITPSNLKGLSVTAGMAVAKGSITGLTFAGYRMEATEIKGLNLAIGWTESDRLTGVSFACYNRTYGCQEGLVIGLFNHTEDLLGIQIGLLNRVENNPAWARILPFINANF